MSGAVGRCRVAEVSALAQLMRVEGAGSCRLDQTNPSVEEPLRALRALRRYRSSVSFSQVVAWGCARGEAARAFGGSRCGARASRRLDGEGERGGLLRVREVDGLRVPDVRREVAPAVGAPSTRRAATGSRDRFCLSSWWSVRLRRAGTRSGEDGEASARTHVKYEDGSSLPRSYLGVHSIQSVQLWSVTSCL